MEFAGVNQSRGAVLDLNVLVSQCRFLNGSMLVSFNNFIVDPLRLRLRLNESISNRLAAEKYRELGSFTGHFRMLSMDAMLYSAMWADNTTLMKLDPLWCPSELATLRSAFSGGWAGEQRLTTVGFMNTFIKGAADIVQWKQPSSQQ